MFERCRSCVFLRYLNFEAFLVLHTSWIQDSGAQPAPNQAARSQDDTEALVPGKSPTSLTSFGSRSGCGRCRASKIKRPWVSVGYLRVFDHLKILGGTCVTYCYMCHMGHMSNRDHLLVHLLAHPGTSGNLRLLLQLAAR